MAGNFPTLKSGNTVFHPVEDTHSFGTDILRFMDDSEQRWRRRNLLRRFRLVCADINAYDSSLILNFYRSQFGRFDSSWSLAFNGSTINNLMFVQDSMKIGESKRNRHSLSFDLMQVKSDLPAIPGPQVYYPPINSDGIITGLPYSGEFGYRTTSDMLDVGKQYAWKWRANPLGTFLVNHPNITTAEVAVLKDFFYGMEGMKGSFIYLDPGGNLCAYSDLFSNAAWTKIAVTLGGATPDPFGGNLATVCTSTSFATFMRTPVIPAGGASGFKLCASVWAKATTVGQTLLIGLIDGSSSILASQEWSLPNGVWTRIYCPISLATNSAIHMFIGGLGTWNSTTINLFSAQCSPMPMPGPRLLTPGMDSLRPKCRFATDDFTIGYRAFGDTSVTLPITEFV